MRSRASGKRSRQSRRLGAVVAISIGVTVLLAAIYVRILLAQPGVAGNTGRPSPAVASIAGERSTTIIVSTPNSNDCRRYQLNVATGQRGDKRLVDCNAESGHKPGRLEAISKAFRDR